MTGLGMSCAVCVMVATLPWWPWWPGRRSGPGRRAARLVDPGGRRGRPAPEAEVEPGPLDVAVLLALVDAAIGSGAGLPRALTAVGEAVAGSDGRMLRRASAALVMGARWEAAWADVPPRLAPVADALAPTWATGSAPGPALRAAASALSRERRTLAHEAAGRLAVRLVLPLGLCFLPAFVLVGLVPVLVSVGGRLLG